MKINQLKALINKGESGTLEFKKTTAQLTPAFETVCAFLNGNGGIVLIGVTNEGKIVGQNVTDSTRQEISNHLAKLEPSAQAYVSISYIKSDDTKYVIHIKCKMGAHVPYIYDGRPYYRNQSTTSKMPQHYYEQLVVKRGQLNYSWEDASVAEYRVNDLDKELIKRTVTLAIQNGRLRGNILNDGLNEVLNKLRLINNKKLTRAAIILFCKKEEKQFIQSQLRLARFRGINKDEFIDNKQYTGNAFYLYDQAMNFLSNYLPIEGKIIAGKPERTDIPAIPYNVLREAVVNALCHRDYSVRGGAISIAIYDDRVEISNIGTLPKEINVTSLGKAHRSILRNPTIAKVFYMAGYIEMWGRGTQNIIELSKKIGNPHPEFIATESDFTVCLPLKKAIISGGSNLQLTPRQLKMLEVLKKRGQMKSIDFAITGFSTRTTQRELLFLKSQGLVYSIGSGPNTVWLPKK